jgi:transposase
MIRVSTAACWSHLMINAPVNSLRFCKKNAQGTRILELAHSFWFAVDAQPSHSLTLLRLLQSNDMNRIPRSRMREKLTASYSDTGRPSIDPELLLRILLIGYLYGITSERRLIEELRMHLAWRWFTDLGFDQDIPHHSTFSKNRHGRFQESKLFEELFERVVRQCVEVGLVRGKQLSVDGSFVEANASKESRIPRVQLAEAAQVNQTERTARSLVPSGSRINPKATAIAVLQGSN